jgi:phosphoglycolate phosphatase
MEIIDKNIRLSKPEVIIFDWDNTLVDAWPLIHKSVHDAFVRFGKKPWSLEETKINIHLALREMLPQLFPDNWREVGTYYREVYLNNAHLLKPLPHVEEMLNMLNKKSIKTSIISNKKTSILQDELERFKWHKYFQSIIGSGSLDVDKPDPKTVRVTLQNLDLQDARNVWFVGDTVTDMETAYNSNSLPIFYGPEDFRNERYINCFPKIHVKNYNEFTKFIHDLA